MTKETINYLQCYVIKFSFMVVSRVCVCRACFGAYNYRDLVSQVSTLKLVDIAILNKCCLANEDAYGLVKKCSYGVT